MDGRQAEVFKTVVEALAKKPHLVDEFLKLPGAGTTFVLGRVERFFKNYGVDSK
jgi:hypothetical protein